MIVNAVIPVMDASFKKVLLETLGLFSLSIISSSITAGISGDGENGGHRNVVRFQTHLLLMPYITMRRKRIGIKVSSRIRSRRNGLFSSTVE
jgi:hypothetical protein